MAQRNWFITGVNSGFGRQMTEQLLARGDRVAGTVRKMDATEDLMSRYGDLLWIARLDVTDVPEIRAVVNRAFADLGRIDVVVNNAGYGLFGAAEELTDDQILHQLNTNLIGSIQVVRAALPHLRAQGGGRIIQLSNLWRSSRLSGRVPLSRQQVGHRGIHRSRHAGSSTLQYWRHHHPAGRSAHCVPLRWRPARAEDGCL